MPRQNYMTIAVPDSTQSIFNDFIAAKDITKTAAMTDVLEMYMLATDEQLYLDLKKKYLKIEDVKEMLSLRNQPSGELIFMKLGTKHYQNQDFSEDDTMQLYIRDCSIRGYTWFSTQSLYFGMSAEKIKYFNKQLSDGKKITILFAGNTILNQPKANEIGYAAEVEAVFSAHLPVPCPEEQAVPASFLNEEARIWLKISNVREERNIKASMLKVTSSGRDLKEVISLSQFHYGYVSFKENP